LTTRPTVRAKFAAGMLDDGMFSLPDARHAARSH
jgi:hypothetical protein